MDKEHKHILLLGSSGLTSGHMHRRTAACRLPERGVSVGNGEEIILL